MAALRIATKTDAVRIGGKGTGSNQCIKLSELETYGCALNSAGQSVGYTSNQLVAVDHLEKNEYIDSIRIVHSASNTYTRYYEQNNISIFDVEGTTNKGKTMHLTKDEVNVTLSYSGFTFNWTYNPNYDDGLWQCHVNKNFSGANTECIVTVTYKNNTSISDQYTITDGIRRETTYVDCLKYMITYNFPTAGNQGNSTISYKIKNTSDDVVSWSATFNAKCNDTGSSTSGTGLGISISGDGSLPNGELYSDSKTMGYYRDSDWTYEHKWISSESAMFIGGSHTTVSSDGYTITTERPGFTEVSYL